MFDIVPYFLIVFVLFIKNQKNKFEPIEYYKIMDGLKKFKGKKFHFIGIGGVSMSALAMMLKREGFYVQGSNDVVNSEVKNLAKKNIRVFLGHSKNNVQGSDIVVYSSAIHEDNPEFDYAVKKKMIMMKRAELLGLISERYKNVIAIAGSHGKTTTTAMLSEVFINAGLKPTVHIGGKLKSIKSNYKLGNKKYFITENCEYKDNFLYVKPDISIVLNIDKDHLDYFKNLEGVKKSFYKYACGTKDGGINLVFSGDENSREIASFENSIKFGFDKKDDICARNVKEYKAGFFSFDAVFVGCKLGNIKLNIVGEHNVLNALVCVLVGVICGIDFCDIKTSIENFSGVERRCERVGEVLGATVYHDYAHHPKQIEKMVLTAKELVKNNNGRIIVIFEPHTFSRTKFLLNDFAKSFVGADFVFLTPVYSARELEEEGLTSIDLLCETKKYVKNVFYNSTYPSTIKHIKQVVKKNDLVLVLGAGNIEKLARMLVE